MPDAAGRQLVAHLDALPRRRELEVVGRAEPLPRGAHVEDVDQRAARCFSGVRAQKTTLITPAIWVIRWHSTSRAVEGGGSGDRTLIIAPARPRARRATSATGRAPTARRRARTRRARAAVAAAAAARGAHDADVGDREIVLEADRHRAHRRGAAHDRRRGDADVVDEHARVGAADDERGVERVARARRVDVDERLDARPRVGREVVFPRAEPLEALRFVEEVDRDKGAPPPGGAVAAAAEDDDEGEGEDEDASARARRRSKRLRPLPPPLFFFLPAEEAADDPPAGARALTHRLMLTVPATAVSLVRRSLASPGVVKAALSRSAAPKPPVWAPSAEGASKSVRALTRSAEVGDGSRGTPSLTAASMVASFFWTTGRIATAWLVSKPASRSAADGSTGQLSSRSSM